MLETLFERDFVVIQGMARGTDQLAAEVALEKGLKVVCAIPFLGQEYKWDKKDRKRYWRILSHPNAYEHYCANTAFYKGALFARNQWMVDQLNPDEDVFVAVMSNKKSGTGHCYRKALEANVRKAHVFDPQLDKWD